MSEAYVLKPTGFIAIVRHRWNDPVTVGVEIRMLAGSAARSRDLFCMRASGVIT